MAWGAVRVSGTVGCPSQQQRRHAELSESVAWGLSESAAAAARGAVGVHNSSGTGACQSLWHGGLWESAAAARRVCIVSSSSSGTSGLSESAARGVVRVSSSSGTDRGLSVSAAASGTVGC
jgi:hypothetical protein